MKLWCSSLDFKHRYAIVQFGYNTKAFDGMWETPTGWYFMLLCTCCGKQKIKSTGLIPREVLKDYTDTQGWSWGIAASTPPNRISQPLVKE